MGDSHEAYRSMYPYKNWLQWVLKARQHHLIDAMDHEPGAFRGEGGRMLQRRIVGMKRFLVVRSILAVLLSFSVIATVASYVLGWLPATEGVESLLLRMKAITTAATTVLTVGYMLTLRTLGQLEMDALMLLPSHRSHWGSQSPPDA